MPEPIVKAVQARRPDLKATDIVVQGQAGIEPRIREFIDAGATKFILVPYVEPKDWVIELESLAENTLHLQS